MDLLKQQKALNKVATALKSGDVVICPTDTIYGFLSDAANKKSVDKIYKIKKRAKLKPLPVFVKDFKMAKELAEIDGYQEKIIKRYWPGKYTFVLKRKKGIKLYDRSYDTIALRMPSYKFLNGLLKKVNKPLVQTSVNISNNPPLIKISDIVEQFHKYDILIIDGGNFKKSKPSKIIDLTKGKIKILRN